MPAEQELWPFKRLAELPPEGTVLHASASVRERSQRALPFRPEHELERLPSNTANVVVIGGGKWIDTAKLWRQRQAPATRLIAVPSIWGSGAEASPIAVLDRDGSKEIHIDPALTPEVRSVWPELADTIPERRARDACGDVWSHALEGFLSPLADAEVREELAVVIDALTGLPIGRDARWFEWSARACAAQARAGVGLVHGIAHTLEGGLRDEDPEGDWGHARLCATFLWPVMAYNRSRSDKWRTFVSQHGLDEDMIFDRLRTLHDSAAYGRALPHLQARWKQVLRDVCTRTNSALVRAGALDWFTERSFQ